MAKFTDDYLFDLPLERQRMFVAICLNLMPNDPEHWPLGLIDQLLATRLIYGLRQFYDEVGRVKSPCQS